MKNRTTHIIAALALTGSAWAASPYDAPYGVQWSFLIGNPGEDNPNAVTVSPDGSVWIATDSSGMTASSPMLTWGSPTGIYGGFFACGYGQMNRNGGILQGNDIPNVTGISGYNQGRNSTVAFAGSVTKQKIAPSKAEAPAPVRMSVYRPAAWSRGLRRGW